MASLPVIVCGKSPAVVLPAVKAYFPEIDVVHICHTVESSKSEIPALLRREAVVPVSGLGSNMDRSAEERRVPVAVITGGAFTPEEFDDVRRTDVQGVPWVRINIENVPLSERPPNPAYPATVAASVKNCLREHGMLDGSAPASNNDGAIWDC